MKAVRKKTTLQGRASHEETAVKMHIHFYKSEPGICMHINRSFNT